MMSKRAVDEKYFAKCNCLIINEHRKAAWGHWPLETDSTGSTAGREVSRAGETWAETPTWREEGLDDTETQIWKKRKNSNFALGVFTLPNADWINPNQVSALVCWDLF